MAKQKQKPFKPQAVKPKPGKKTIRKDYTPYWVAAGLLLVLIIYLPSLTNGITNWDDNIYTNNPYVTNLSPAGIVKIFSVYLIGNYHPLTLLSLGFDRLIGGGGPFMFHFTNLLLHLLNSLLVYLLVKRLTNNNLLALFTFALFGVHTLHVESVAWISERKDVLYSLFFLVSLTFYTGYASGRKGIQYGLSLLFFILSLLAKGQAVVLVVLLPFIDLLKERKWFSVRILSEKIPFLLLSLIFSWVAFRAQASTNAIHTGDFSMAEQFAFASYGFTQYLVKSIFPIGLSAVYAYPLRSANGGIPIFYWFFILPLPVYAVGFYYLIKRSKIYAFGLGMFFLSLLPLLQIIPVGGAILADRYFYIPSVGLLLCFAMGLLEIRNTQLRYGLFLFFVLFLSGLSYARNNIWKDSLTLWNDVISKNNQDWSAYSNRSMAYEELGQWENAIADCSSAIAINPKKAIAWYNRGVAFENLGQTDKAIADYSQTIAVDPDFIRAYSNRGLLYSNQEQWDKSLADYAKAIMIDPEYVTAYYNRGLVYSKLAQWDKGIADFTKTVSLDPNNTKAYFNRGLINSNLEQYDKAIADYTLAIRLDPEYSKAVFNRGLMYSKLGQFEKAIGDLTRLTEIDPNSAKAYFNRGVIFSRMEQPEKAIADFSKALQLDPRYTKAETARAAEMQKINGGIK